MRQFRRKQQVLDVSEDGKLCESCSLEEGTTKRKLEECQKLERAWKTYCKSDQEVEKTLRKVEKQGKHPKKEFAILSISLHCKIKRSVMAQL